MVINNMIKHFLITANDVTNPHTMFGPNIDGTRWKKVQQNPDRVAVDYVALPREFMKLNNFVTLLVDVIFMNNIKCLITMSNSIKFMTV